MLFQITISVAGSKSDSLCIDAYGCKTLLAKLSALVAALKATEKVTPGKARWELTRAKYEGF